MHKIFLYTLFGLLLLSSYDKEGVGPITCENNSSLNVITQRSFENGETLGYLMNKETKGLHYQFVKKRW